jgi:hypothetical protein
MLQTMIRYRPRIDNPQFKARVFRRGQMGTEVIESVFIIDIGWFHANEDELWFLILYNRLKMIEEDLNPCARGTTRQEV